MLADKNLDLVVYNDVSVPGIGFDATDNEVTLVTREGERQLARAPKEQIAAGILDEVGRLLQERRGSA
jgi:phosphopantothenoylcysteine decarboxylase/phosphopantothenate--cysteine ligase